MKYKLYDLEILTIGNPDEFNCAHILNEGLRVRGEHIEFLPGTRRFSHYVLATLMPYIAAKQRADQPTDWMYYESEIACPDPLCKARFKINRLGQKTYNYNVRNS